MAKSKNNDINAQIFYALKVSEESRVPFLFMSAPGMGKSTSVDMFAKIRGYELEVLRGNSTSESEVMGYDVVDTTPGSKSTIHLRPSWYNKVLENAANGKRTLLFLDEITTCPEHVQSALLHLIFERKVGDENIPEDTLIVSAGNYSQSLGNTFGLIPPLMNRFCIFNIVPEKEDVKLSDSEISWIESIAKKIRSNFATVDIARKADGELVIMELGDGQVSGLQQIDEKVFYQSFDSEEGIPVEEFFPEGTVILSGNPMPDKTAEQMQLEIEQISNTQELVDAYVLVHNKFWYIEDDLYDYEEGTEDYIRVRDNVEAWGEMMDLLDDRVMSTAKEEGLLAERQPDSGTIKQFEEFMKKYGYRDGRGWWVKIER